MKIILSQMIGSQEYIKNYLSITKEFESNIIPHIGDSIYDSLWKNPYEYEVMDIVINYSENECLVALSGIITSGKEELKYWQNEAQKHKWKIGSN